MSDTTRRAVIAGAAGLTAASILAACGDDSTDGSGSTGGGGAATTGGDPPTDGGAAGGGLASTSDIPVGGGKIIDGKDIVITQPTAGTFKAFSATCTHEGCTVAKVDKGVIQCPCHMSQFSAADGSVKQGPATKPLIAKQIKVEGTSINLA